MIKPTRNLRAHTVLPPNLYVRRHADNQLDQIIEEMGRPGYVLVARQMGKTNLLLNMKRSRESEGDIVVYVDLSQRFKTARACFRHIIDLTLEANDEQAFDAARLQISQNRNAQSADPSLEYTRALRAIMKCVPDKKLIIVLDEIDSLVNAPYSDIILAHIRSTYFVRANYPEFERLTYVLSGVAEPSDLIKDKNISPFNIGEKIYLTNFDWNEIKSFNRQSDLNLSEAVLSRVFYWTAGNPRMTWDICSALEQETLNSEPASPTLVDKIVDRIYLTSFDRAPVDHMRVLVSGDVGLRSALVAIRYNKGDSVDDNLRSRLYLAGITNNVSEQASIQNPIVDAALSDAWIKQVESTRQSPAHLAMEHYIGTRYGQAIELFEQARANGNVLSVQHATAYGFSLFREGKYLPAADELKEVIDKQRGESKTTIAYYLGSSLLLTGEQKPAFDVLQSAVEIGSGPYHFPAELVLAAANYQLGQEIDNDLRDRLVKKIIEALSQEDFGSDLVDPTLVPSHLYTLSYAALGAGFADDARQLIDATLKIAPAGLLPTMLMTRYAILDDEIVKRTIVTNAAKSIVEHQLHPVDNGGIAGAYTHATLLTVLIELSNVDALDDMIELMRFVRKNEKSEISELELAASYFVDYGHEPTVSFRDVQRVLTAIAPTARSAAQSVAYQRALSTFTPLSGKLESFRKFLDAMEKSGLNDVTSEDVRQAVGVCQTLLGDSDFRKAAPIITRTIAMMSPEVEPFWRFFAHYYSMTIHNGLYNRTASWDAASAVMSVYSELKDEDTAEIPDFVATVVDQAAKVLARPKPAEPDRYRNIGRNQKVVVKTSGGEIRPAVKFKIVEDDLRDGKLDLVRILSK